MSTPPSSELIDRFVAVVGESHALRADADQSHYTDENRGIVAGRTPVVLKPGSTEQVSQILSLASETRTPIVPQGGHTGHVGAGAPSPAGDEIVVSLERMNRIVDIDTTGNTVTAQAGVVLETLQNAASDAGRLFPLSLAAQGSCMIGGNISTNAGGTGVLAYGNMRDLVLGLEVVLPSGEIWDGLNRLRKNNTGYDLKHLFIGAEGTLGIVTTAVLKLFAAPKDRQVAFVALASPDDALAFFEDARAAAGQQLTAFELIPRIGMEFVVRHHADFRELFTEPHPWYALVEISSVRSAEEARGLAEEVLSAGLETGRIRDAVIAESLAQREVFWAMRERLPPTQKLEGASIAHDISVPLNQIPTLLKRGETLIAKIAPGARMVAFGHMGDGNIHFNFSQPVDMDTEAYLRARGEVNQAVYDLVGELGGSISAEHGIGLFKVERLARIKPPVEMAMMRSVKRVLDPLGIMNPGKVLAGE